MKTNELLVTEIQRFCMHDGPGIRTVVFLQGCPLNCKWCHNEETKSKNPVLMFQEKKCIGCGACVHVCENHVHEVLPNRVVNREACQSCGKCVEVCPQNALSFSSQPMRVDEIMDIVKKEATFYLQDGGMTVSGGEPTFQWEGLKALLTECKNANISTCLETCGIFSSAHVEELASLTDIFLFDLKDTNPERLRENTGADYRQVVENLLLLDRMEKRIVLRCIIVPEVNMNEEHLNQLAKLADSLSHVEYVELLPYHPYGSEKAKQVGVSQTIYSKPNKEEFTEFALQLKNKGIAVKCFGSLL